MSTMTTIRARSSLGEASAEKASRPHVWFVGALTIAAMLCLLGYTTPTRISEDFHLDPLFILIALDRFAAMVDQTGALSVLARRITTATRGSARRTAALLVVFLMVAGSVNNNLTTCLLVLPTVLLTLRAVEASAAGVTRTTALVLAAGNVAGAATPTGDFPALILIASGVISYGEYVKVGTPLFVLTAAVLALIYGKLLPRPASQSGSRLGFALIALASRHDHINRPALVRLAVVFAGMVVAWIVVDPAVAGPAVIAWIGLVIAGTAVHGTGVALRLDAVELKVSVKLAGILLASAALASTGVVAEAADRISSTFTSPITVVVALMILTAVTAGLTDAAAAAAGLLPLVVTLTQPGALLAPCRPLTVIAYAASVCAGSSLFTTSATAGQLLEERVTSARLTSRGKPVRFTFGAYARYGVMNFTVQLGVAIAYVTVAILIFGAAGQ